MPLQREIAAVAVAGGMFAPNLTPGLLTATRTGSLPAFWRDALAWVRDHTPPPFAAASTRGVDPYLQRYSGDAIPVPDYTVMNWWDHGYWMVQVARRVPVSNPTQVRAPNAARFYASTTEQEALEILRAERSRYVIADWELPFRPTAGGTIMGRFQNVVDWAGGRHARYYEIYYLRQNNAWTPVWVFHQPYYESMTYRLMALGGQGAAPQNASTVVRFGERVDDKGLRFREVLSVDTYATYEAARIAASRHRAAEAAVVGLDPWRTAFPLEPLKSMVEVHASRTSEQKETETPWVRVFEVRTP